MKKILSVLFILMLFTGVCFAGTKNIYKMAKRASAITKEDYLKHIKREQAERLQIKGESAEKESIEVELPETNNTTTSNDSGCNFLGCAIITFCLIGVATVFIGIPIVIIKFMIKRANKNFTGNSEPK